MARMSAAHLAAQGGGYEPQRKFDFEVEIYGIPGAETVKLSVLSFTVPTLENDDILLPYLNNVIHAAGQAKYGDGVVVCRDFVDEQTYSALFQWKKLVTDFTTKNIGFASSYKKQGDVILLAPDGSTERHIKLSGLWPSILKDNGLSHAEGTAVHEVEMTLKCDSVEPQF